MSTTPPARTRIDRCFEALRTRGEKGFVAYITAGDPDLEATAEHVLRLERAGVDIVEPGIPFSDPLADGKVNQESAARALAAGTTIKGVFETVQRLRAKTDIPVMCYCYMNLLFAPGFERTIKQAARSGVDGMLILDLPAEESKEYADGLHRAGLNHITLITPTSPDARIREIVRHGSGFVYAVSRTGVTGMQKKIASDANDLLKRARRATDLPLALGFGISNPAQAAAAARYADAIVVGSAIVQRFHEAGRSHSARKRAGEWVASMVQAVKER
jgi:tryptophan synthase alpha chain